MGTNFVVGANVHANGIRQHYLRYGGRGRPLILIPGITSPAITWGFVAEELATSFDVYVLDVRGRGLSECGPLMDYGIDACADDIACFVAELGLKLPIVLGHSMGARHIIRAVARGANFDIALLIDPPVSGPSRRVYPTKLPWYIESMALARKGADVQTLRSFTPSWTDGQIALRAEWLHTCDERAVITSYEGFHEDDIHKDIAALTLRTLLVGAEHGDVIRDDDVREIKGLNNSFEFKRVPNAGHMIPWDNFEGFFDAIYPFLTRS
jgi:N-formylmaleamate deformylase